MPYKVANSPDDITSQRLKSFALNQGPGVVGSLAGYKLSRKLFPGSVPAAIIGTSVGGLLGQTGGSYADYKIKTKRSRNLLSKLRNEKTATFLTVANPIASNVGYGLGAMKADKDIGQLREHQGWDPSRRLAYQNFKGNVAALGSALGAGALYFGGKALKRKLGLKKAASSDGQRRAVDRHFNYPTKRHRWIEFSRRLKQPGYRELLLEDARSDNKLKKFIHAMAEHHSGKDLGTIKNYKIRKSPSGRITCDCKDWKFRRSLSGEDCKHIKEFKNAKKI